MGQANESNENDPFVNIDPPESGERRRDTLAGSANTPPTPPVTDPNGNVVREDPTDG